MIMSRLILRNMNSFEVWDCDLIRYVVLVLSSRRGDFSFCWNIMVSEDLPLGSGEASSDSVVELCLVLSSPNIPNSWMFGVWPYFGTSIPDFNQVGHRCWSANSLSPTSSYHVIKLLWEWLETSPSIDAHECRFFPNLVILAVSALMDFVDVTCSKSRCPFLF